MRKVLLTLIIVAHGVAMVGYALGSRRFHSARDGGGWNGAARFRAVEQESSGRPVDLKIRGARSAITASDLEEEPRVGTEFTGEVATFVLPPGAGPDAQQQGGDQDFNPNVARPAYLKLHPKVLFDEGHNNADTSRGRYKAFADLIASDGYRIAANTGRFSRATLTGSRILVVVNAAGTPGQISASPFTESELDAVRDWVSKGGALLLITDHLPYCAAAATLSKRFDINITQGYTIDTSKYNKESEDQTELVFTRDDGLLAEHPITRGRDAAEQVRRIVTFAGTSIKGPPKSVAFLRLSDTAMDVLPPDRKPSANPEDALPEHRPVSAAGRAQGIALEFGLGRVVVLSDAAILMAQVGSRGYRFGMNVRGVDNRQLGLNLMHWLSGLLR